MKYSVKEFRDNLISKIFGLGVTKDFKNNPAFNSALMEIDVLLAQMNIFTDDERIMVTESNGTISFVWETAYDVRYSVSLEAATDKTFRFVVVEDHKPSLDKTGDFVRTKRVVEKVATITDANEVILTTNGSIVKNVNKSQYSTVKVWVERKVYNGKGVMREREFRTYDEIPIKGHVEDISVPDALSIPRQAFMHGYKSEEYDTKNYMIRNKLDTARVSIEDRSNGSRFCGELPLSNQHGLKNMELFRDFDYPKEVLIKPLSDEEIAELLSREKNEIVASGLRDYAVGRTEYYYSSVEDKMFVSESKDEGKRKAL